MKIRERIIYKNTTIRSLNLYDMFVLKSREKIYMYVMSASGGPRYLELKDGVWKDSMIAFNIDEQVSIINVEELEYSKMVHLHYDIDIEDEQI